MFKIGDSSRGLFTESRLNWDADGHVPKYLFRQNTKIVQQSFSGSHNVVLKDENFSITN